MNYMMMFPPHAPHPPAVGPSSATYTATSVGVGVAVVLTDVSTLLDLGWYSSHAVGNGTSAQRPVGVIDGTQWRDDTLGAVITWTGASGTTGSAGVWRNASGVIV